MLQHLDDPDHVPEHNKRTPLFPSVQLQMAYFDKKRYATDDAMRVGRLHTFLPGWTDANVAFMRSGGYAISARIKDVSCPTLVVWGRNDEILRWVSGGTLAGHGEEKATSCCHRAVRVSYRSPALHCVLPRR